MHIVPTPTPTQIAENVERFDRLRPEIRAELQFSRHGLGKSDVMTTEQFLDAMADAIRQGLVIIADDDRTFCLTERGAAASAQVRS